jgi:hypothetical protein
MFAGVISTAEVVVAVARVPMIVAAATTAAIAMTNFHDGLMAGRVDRGK